jgi:protein involved in polysaccharide export with SLBB domain
MKRLLAIISLAWIVPCFAQLDYLLKPMENILIRAPQSPQIDGRIFQIQSDGFITLPSIGRIHAGGQILRVFQKSLANRLSPSSRSAVTVSVVSFRSAKPATPQR